jgi:hypothetical protein
VGLRYDAEATADALDRLFPGARVDDRRVPDNYSIALGGSPATRGAGSSRSLKLLVQGGTQLVRSRSGGRVLAGLLAYLSADLTEPDPALVRLDATAAVRGEDGLLLPPGPVNWVNQLQPRFGRVGIALVDSPHAVLDLATNELVVSAPAIPHDPVVLDELDRGVRTGAELPWVRPGRYPLTAWFLPHAEVRAKPLTRGVAVTTALPQLFDLQDLATAVDQLADLFERIEARGVWYTSAAELVAQVKSVLG